MHERSLVSPPCTVSDRLRQDVLAELGPGPVWILMQIDHSAVDRTGHDDQRRQADLGAYLAVVRRDVGQVVGEAERQPNPGRPPRGNPGTAANVERWMWPGPRTYVCPHRHHPLDKAVHQ